MKNRVLILLLTFCYLVAPVSAQLRVDPLNPNVLIPDSSIPKAEDAGVAAHTNYMFYIGPWNPSGEIQLSLTHGPAMLALTMGGYSPSQIKSAYGLPSAGGIGTICIVDAYDYPTALNDFNVFSAQFGLPQETSTNATASTNQHFQVLYATGSKPIQDSGWNTEEALDIEWAHAMAPNAKIVLVEAASSNLTDLLQGVSAASNLSGVKEISCSWGSQEFPGETSYDSDFTKSGVIFFASAGDVGGQQSWPAESPNVVGCGGTSLIIGSNGMRQSETAWSESGGGPSAYEPRPSYQNVISTIVGSTRGCPDEAADADPQTGVAVYDSTPNQGSQGWTIVGGTSLSSPLLAGICNLENNGESSTQAELSLIYNIYGSGSYANYFYDITSGTAGNYSATAGWDFITGVGSPNGLLTVGVALSNFYVSPSTIAGGESTHGVVQLVSAAPSGGETVSLTSTNSLVKVPSSVVVPAGSTGVSFTITTLPTSSNITVTLDASAANSTKQTTVNLTASPFSNFYASPSTIDGGQGTRGVVQVRQAAPSGGDVINLASSSSLAQVPSSVTIPAGSTGVSFAITTSPVSASETITLYAAFDGASKATPLILEPYPIKNFYTQPSSVVGGETTHGVVQLSGPAGPNGDKVSLSSSDSHATVPSTVTVPAGSTGVSFTILTSAVSSSTQVTLTATLGSSTMQTTLTLNP